MTTAVKKMPERLKLLTYELKLSPEILSLCDYSRHQSKQHDIERCLSSAESLHFITVTQCNFSLLDNRSQFDMLL